MPTETRRAFNKQALGSLLTFSLLETLCQHDTLAADVRPITSQWLHQLQQMALDLKHQQIEQVAWQKKVEELLGQVDLPELLERIDFDRLTANVKYPEAGALSMRFSFDSASNPPSQLAFGRQIFALKKGRSVVPHGHNNMATAFLILKGDLRGRHYDRIRDESDYLIIRPSGDRTYKPGEPSTISDVKDNIHWFEALTEPAFIFNIHVMDIVPGAVRPSGRVYVDPNGEKLSDGLIRAKRIGYKQANERYG